MSAPDELRRPIVCRAKVMAAIRAGVTTAGAIEKCSKLKMRETDRALQALRREGRIVFDATQRQWREA